ncbi:MULTISPECIES: pseudouridine synthase [Flavobacteriaceae]|uniref:Pseudouridine synthase n=2 Tax=Flavobacteriaceae TaxID=49546 RepID=A0A4Y8AVJ8_9FLAO|nr:MULTISPECIES: pseudouridine synthase [Flavobacteriaceae]TEW75392.1 pseudouridine synthase [Gramella jeungdoensis]GGK44854.1 pseudouridine synthase [Lutibacter litoralis]
MKNINHQHFAIFKPDGYLSQFVNNEQRKNKKKLLGEFYDFPENIMAIGRLDEKSEGLLLLTTDGKASELIRSKQIEKEYYVQVDGIISNEAIERLKTGVEITIETGNYTTIPCKVFCLKETPTLPKRNKKIRDDRHGPTSWISIILTEGKFRQIRKMTAAVGFPTLRLVRLRIGKFELQNMIPGEVRSINI